MTAIQGPAMASRDGRLLRPEDTSISLSSVANETNDSSVSTVPDMTVSLRKDSSIEGYSPIKASEEPSFVLPKCPQFPVAEFHPVETFVGNAITSKDSNSKAYRAILDSIRKADDPPMLCKVLLALRGTTLNHLSGNPKTHAHLLHLVFRLDSFIKEEHPKLPNLYSLADAHLHLIVALVSANSVYLTPGMNALWRLIVNEPNAPAERTSRVHAALATMLRLVPKGNSELFPVLASSFPFRTRPASELVWYTQACLQVLQYVPTLHAQLLELLLDKCLEMDVEIKIEEDGKVSIDASSHSLDDAEEEMFELEIDNDASNHNSRPLHPDHAEEQVDEMADKLDSMMTILLEHICSYAQERGTQSLYQMISPVFDSSVLTTHRSKFVQFVVLVICGLEHEQLSGTATAQLDREFAAKLIDIVLDPYRATVTRQSGACYLASFVSRATFVSPETTCEAVSALLKWAEAYMSSDYSTRASDVKEQCELHSLFYTVCQAAFYIMCFRGADAIKYYRSAMEHSATREGELPSDDDVSYLDPEHVDVGPERWTKVCGHELQPLRFCLESVRGEFLHIAHVYKLLPPPLLNRLNADDSRMSTQSKRRKPSVITTAATLAKARLKGGVGGIGRGSNPLDSFFPYDPYLLCRSHRFVEPYYKNWEGSIEEDEGLCDDEADEEGSASDESDASSDTDSEDDDDDDATDDGAKHMPNSAGSTSYLQPMSYVSSATIESNLTEPSFQPATPETITQKKQVQREAWSETLKRSRAPSIENGSW